MSVENYQAFAQELVRLLRQHDVHAMDIRFSLPGSGVFEEARMTYNQGRHGSPGTINLIVTTRIGDFKEEPAA